MAKRNEIQLIKQLDRNDKAVRDNFESMRKQYANKYVAVDKGKIILSDSSLENLKKRLQEKRIAILTVLIQYIPAKGVVILY